MIAALRDLGRRIHATADGQARTNGLTVTLTRHGLGRSYRDPRFDSFPAPVAGQSHTRQSHAAPEAGHVMPGMRPAASTEGAGGSR